MKAGQGAGFSRNPFQLMHYEAYLAFRQGVTPENDFTDRAINLRKVIAMRKELESKLKHRE